MQSILKLIPGIFICLLFFSCKSSPQVKNNIQNGDPLKFYTGSYTRAEGHVDGQSQGIEYLEINPVTGEKIIQKTAAEVINPSFVASTKDGKHLYAVSELAQMGESTGYLYAYRVKEDHELEEIGKYSSNGRAPCHVIFDQSEKMVFVSNYLDAQVTVFNKLETGLLVENTVLTFEGNSITNRQEAPHLHSVKISPNNQKVFIADLGSDKVWIFDLNVDKKTIFPSTQPFIEMAPGAGPRHIAVASDISFYVINELNSTISFVRQEENIFKIVQTTSTLPSTFEGENSCADIHLHSSGKFVFASNRGHNSIAAFKINAAGLISPIDYYSTEGKVPRNFNITKDGKWLLAANQNSNNLTLYSINESNGQLTLQHIIEEINTPVCVEWNRH
jgi:6-phosphogluconolactonase